MKKNAILFSASNYEKSSLIRADDLPGVKYDIQAIHKRLIQIGFDVKQIENVSKDQMIIPLRRSRLSGKTETICPDRRKPLNLLLCAAKPHVCYCA